MLGSLRHHDMSEDVVSRAGIDLQTAYEEKLLPLERRHDFHEFHPTPPPDFTSKPLVAVVGAAGCGKTALVSWLVGRHPYPAAAGSELSTALVWGAADALVPGPAALASPHGKDFAPFKKLGNAFLSRFQVAVCAAEPLRSVSVLECRWSAAGAALPQLSAAADVLLLLVEATRAAELPPQLPRLLAARPDAARLLLTKADAVPYHQLLRVYGALMWTLAQVMPAADPPRLLVLSLRQCERRRPPGWQRALFRQDAAELLTELRQAPRLACAQRLSALAQRAALAQLHAALAAAVGRRLGGSRRATAALLVAESERLRREQRSLVSGREDLVAAAAAGLRARLLRWDRQAYDAARLRALRPELLRAAASLLSEDVPAAARLLLQQPGDGIVRGGAFDAVQDAGTDGGKDASLSSREAKDCVQHRRAVVSESDGSQEKRGGAEAAELAACQRDAEPALRAVKSAQLLSAVEAAGKSPLPGPGRALSI